MLQIDGVQTANMSFSPTETANRIFISYRRDDAAGFVISLAEKLRGRFGQDSVFVDTDLPAAVNFVNEIKAAISSSKVLLVIIGKQWLPLGESLERSGEPDYVRLEIATAFSKNVPVIPVLVGGAAMPKPKELPPDIQDLAGRNAFVISTLQWKEDVARLIDRLSGIPGLPLESASKRKLPLMLLIAGAVVATLALGLALKFYRSRQPSPPPTPKVHALFHKINTLRTDKAPYKVALNANGTLAAIVGGMKEVQVWRVTNFEPLTLSGPGGYGRSLAFYPSDESLIASGSDDSFLRIWRVGETKPLKEIPAKGGYAFGLAFSTDGQFASTSSRDPSTEVKTAKIWQVKDWSVLYKCETRNGETLNAVNPNSRLAAVSSTNGVFLKVLNQSCDSRFLSAQPKEIRVGVFSDRGRLLALGIKDGTRTAVQVWDVASGRLFYDNPAIADGDITSLALSPDDKMLVAGFSDGRVLGFLIENGESVGSIERHDSNVVSVAFSGDGKVFASAGTDGKIILSQIHE